MAKCIVLAVGGTGGHLFPAIDLGKQLQKEGYRVVLLGHNLSKNPFAASQFPTQDILAAPISSLGQFLWKTPQGIFQAMRFLRKLSPQKVIGFGSYHAFSVLVATVLLRIPLHLFEANTELGQVNRLLTPFAQTVGMQFPFVRKKVVSLPLLPWRPFLQVEKKKALAYYGKEEEKTTVLVFGGSQGAQVFAAKIPAVLSHFPHLRVLHFSGRGKPLPQYGSLDATLKPFEEHMEYAYRIADLAIVRGGAGTIAECIQAELPALIIPFPAAKGGHQVSNGRFFVEEVGGGRMVLERESTEERLQEELEQLLGDLLKYKGSIRAWKEARRGAASVAAWGGG